MKKVWSYLLVNIIKLKTPPYLTSGVFGIIMTFSLQKNACNLTVLIVFKENGNIYEKFRNY